ncbi:ABC transporter ATP-binding protein [Aestuariispira insulae]|uniref:ABC-type multidrug transport system fused ATPase/permease subunit n=1 Tax=Aestuariispira insulae TaxID=1461337 RepID=A0A3D9H467_9PROT|nr:ABC transporter ATP-binding protein [Aestuariispira insulae]RED44303.1 ABC-type multidrug transport system fused ATPase/permease subunit [Aestuariispira insulae]
MISFVLRYFFSERFEWVFYRSLPYLMAFKGTVISLVFIGLAIVAFDIVSAGVVAVLAIAPNDGATQIPIPLLAEVTIPRDLVGADNLLLVSIGLIVLLQILREGMLYLSQYLPAKLAAVIEYELKKKLTENLVSDDHESIKSAKKNDLILQIMNYSSSFSNFISEVVLTFNVLVVAVLYIFTLFILEPYPFLVVSLVVGIVLFLTNKLVTVQEEIGGKLRQTNLTYHDRLHDVVYGLVEVIMNNRQATFLERQDQLAGNIRRDRLWLALVSSSVSPLQRGLGLLMIGGILILLDVLTPPNESLLTIERSLLVLFLVVRLYGPISQFNVNRSSLLNKVVGAQALLEFMDKRDVAKAGPHEPALQEKKCTYREETDVIQLNGVTCGYGAEGAPILHDVNISLRPNTVTALVGPSGAGKSTVIKLLTRFLDPAKGTITVSGRDIMEFPLEQWRLTISMIQQHGHIFYGTIAENISMFDSGIPRSRIVQAAENSGISDYIDNLPEGYDTVVGGKDIALSGGQRQKILIARALVRRPKLLILDEATSAQDALSENEILQRLKENYSDLAILVIAHRFSAIRDAREIYVLENGRVVENGSWNDLMKRGGLFREMAELQSLEKAENSRKPAARSDS